MILGRGKGGVVVRVQNPRVTAIHARWGGAANVSRRDKTPLRDKSVLSVVIVCARETESGDRRVYTANACNNSVMRRR